MRGLRGGAAPVPGAAARPGSGSWARPPRHPDHPRQHRGLDRPVRGPGGGPAPVPGAAARPGAGPRPRPPRHPHHPRATSRPGPASAGTRPGRCACPGNCCPTRCGSWAPTTPTPLPPATTSRTGPAVRGRGGALRLSRELLPDQVRVLGPRPPRHPGHPHQHRGLDRRVRGPRGGPAPVRELLPDRAGPRPRPPPHPDHPGASHRPCWARMLEKTTRSVKASGARTVARRPRQSMGEVRQLQAIHASARHHDPMHPHVQPPTSLRSGIPGACGPHHASSQRQRGRRGRRTPVGPPPSRHSAKMKPPHRAGRLTDPSVQV